MRDPYHIYAQKILRLEELEPLDADPAAREIGNFVHDALEKYARHIMALPAGEQPSFADSFNLLQAYGRESLAPYLDRPAVQTLWWPRFERIANWFLKHQLERNGAMEIAAVEINGALTFTLPGGVFTLSAKADRIDRYTDADNKGQYEIIDYKTGTPPGSSDIMQGLSPQLTLEALMIERGGFSDHDLPASPVAGLSYWQLKGGSPIADIKDLKLNRKPVDRQTLEVLIEKASQGLTDLITHFDTAETAYLSEPHDIGGAKFAPYRHLARQAEWLPEMDIESLDADIAPSAVEKEETA